ncbi:hypothetical protein D557_0992 [Bordetella holmesii 70147]|nr:hypothetical protein D555_1748 [Bordetella holmesii 35009]EWM51140.1 hypothetical protein D557_0992 [Bordetella holmesii 70147]
MEAGTDMVFEVSKGIMCNYCSLAPRLALLVCEDALARLYCIVESQTGKGL